MIKNLPAEMAVVGAALLGNPGPLLMLTDQDLTDRRHMMIAGVVRDVVRREQPVDALVVLAELGKRGQTGRAGVDPAYVSMLGSHEVTPVVASAGYYAEIVRTATRVRVAAAAAEQFTAALVNEDAALDMAELVALHSDRLGALPPELADETCDDPLTVADVLGMEFPESDMLWPGLMSRGERVVIVAGEGLAKSTVSTMLAVAASAGCHPFTGERVGPPMRVLLVDAENSMQQTQHRYDWVGKRYTNAVPGWAHNIQCHIRPEGLDLAGKDREWFRKVAEDAAPDLIVVGPAYKLMAGDAHRDTDVQALLAVFDEVRVKHNAAMFIEAHGGHGTDASGTRIPRPFGSSIWLRWAEIGLGLKRSEGDQGDPRYATELEVGRWKGDREPRDWPALLERGLDHQVPWSPVAGGYWQTAQRKAAGQ